MRPVPPRLLCVYKKSQVELYHEHEPSFIDRFRQREPDLWEQFETTHAQNRQAIERVRKSIRDRGLEAWFVYRADYESAEGFDLVVAVGGDGTLLDVSHFVHKRPLLGVNSLPGSSVGHFCATDSVGFGETLDLWLAGKLGTISLNRLRVTIEGRALAVPVLNEVLYAHPIPAAMSRYMLKIDGHSEVQKSSGIWIGTAAGSTGAMQSAGGELMDIQDQRTQYVVREPFNRLGRSTLHRGLLDGPIRLTSMMRSSSIYIDGHREIRNLTLGDRIRVDRHPWPLQLVGRPDAY